MPPRLMLISCTTCSWLLSFSMLLSLVALAYMSPVAASMARSSGPLVSTNTEPVCADTVALPLSSSSTAMHSDRAATNTEARDRMARGASGDKHGAE